MKSTIRQQTGMIKFLAKKYGYKESELAWNVSMKRTDRFDDLNSEEASRLIEFLNEVEVKKNIYWILLLYAFELDIIDTLSLACQRESITEINKHLKDAGE